MNIMRIGLCAVALSVGLSSSMSHAQSVPVERFTLAARPDDAFHAARLGRVGHKRFGVSLAGDYGYRPLELENSSTEVRVIEHHLMLQANLSLSLFDRLVLFAGLGASAVMEGDTVPRRFREQVDPADGAGLGDIRIGARLRLAGEQAGPVALGIQAIATLPTADMADDSQRYQGEQSVAVTPEAILEFRAKKQLVTVTLNAGVHIRENQTFVDAKLGDELRYGLAVGVRPVEPLELIAEGYGAFSFEDFGESGNTVLEALAGAKYHHKSGFYVGLAGGTGLRHGYGTPRARAVLMLGWLTEGEVEPPPDLPPDVPPPPPDTDADGILDPSDSCPREAEDADGFEDEDGCPDLDNDKDGVPDTSDKCSNEAEDVDQFEDEDGCPDLDNDNDGRNDADDKCPNEAEDVDLFEDEDGCPDLDNDNDGVPDASDACPMEPGTAEEKGCPKAIRVEGGVIRLLQQINFANNSDVILGESNSIMEELRATMRANARIAHVRVEGHTDDRGSDKKNLALSKKRAASVTRWLISRGVDATRLEAWGCGELQPLDTNKTADGRAKNRRVVFHITDPVPPTGAVPPIAGCERAD